MTRAFYCQMFVKPSVSDNSDPNCLKKRKKECVSKVESGVSEKEGSPYRNTRLLKLDHSGAFNLVHSFEGQSLRETICYHMSSQN